MFQVSVDEPGQMDLALNGTELGYTVSGRATGTTQIVRNGAGDDYGSEFNVIGYGIP